MDLTDLVVMRHGSFPDGRWRVDCDVPLRLTVTKAISLGGGATEIRRQGGDQLVQTDTLTAAQTLEFWTTSQLAAGTSVEVTRTFGSDAAFHVLLRFHYVDDAGTPGTVAGDILCPARNELTGKYALSFINGRRVPADDGVYNVYYDTLVFLSQFNYYSKDSVSLVSNPSQRSGTVTEPRAYLIISETELSLATIYAAQPGGVMQIERNAITQQRDTPEGPIILRFDRVP